MADGRRRTDDPAADREVAAAGRVARLDGISGGGAEPTRAVVARFGDVLGSAADPAEAEDGPADGPRQAPEASGLVDFGQLDAAGSDPARPVADLAAPAEVIAPPTGGGQGEQKDLDGGRSGPVALFDSASLGAGRDDVAVAELGPGALNRRAARGGRAGRRTGDGAERGRSAGAGGARAAARNRGSAATGDRGGKADLETGGRSGRRRGRPDQRLGSDEGPPVEASDRSLPDPARRTAARAGPGRLDREADEPGSRLRGQRGRGPAEVDPDADPVAVAREICLRLLTDRARTRQELAQALRRKGVPDEAAQPVLERFDEVGLIDDAAFAGQWVRSRHVQRGLARRAIAMELRRKGVSDEDAGEALAEVDTESEERRARELVDRKMRSLAVGTAEQRAAAGRRLVGMLARKGYGAGIAYRVVKEALAERGAEADELGDGEITED
jgi:regulatory protein